MEKNKNRDKLKEEINELKEVKILADKCQLPLTDIKNNIDNQISKIANMIKEKEGKEEKPKRKGKGKQITKFVKSQIKKKKKKENLEKRLS